jgi:mRNA turnover protein 4
MFDPIRYFKDFRFPDYAKAGSIADRDVVLSPGPLAFPTPMLDQLRQLGLVVEIDNGQVMLRNRFVAASEGEPLTPEQAKLLVHLDIKMAEFSIQMLCHWNGGNFEELS